MIVPFRKLRLRPGVAMGAFLAAAIGGTLVGGAQVAIASMIVFVCVILYYARNDPVQAAILLIAYLAMEGMYKYLTSFATYVYIVRPALMAAIITSWASARLSRTQRADPVPFGGLVVVFILWALLEVFNPYGTGLLTGLSTCLLFYAGPLIFWWIGATATRSPMQVERLCLVVLAVATVVSSLAALQFGMGRPWTEAHFPGYSTILQGDWFVITDSGTVGSFRPASTTSMGGGGAAWAALGTTIALGLVALPQKSRRADVFVIACLLANVVGLFVSGVRLYVFTSIASICVYLILTIRNPSGLLRGVVALVILCVFGFIAWEGAQTLSGGILSQRYSQTMANPVKTFTYERGANFPLVFRLLVRDPLGTGYHASKLDVTASGPSAGSSSLELRTGETQFGATASDLGLPGLLLHFALVIGAVRAALRSHKRLLGARARTFSAILLATMSIHLVACLGGPALQGAIYFWFAAGILLALPRIEQLEQHVLGQLLKTAAGRQDGAKGVIPVV